MVKATLMLALLTTGCAGMQAVRDTPLSQGDTHVFHAGPDQTLSATKAMLSEMHPPLFEPKEERQIDGGGVMLLSEPSMFGIVRVVVQPYGGGTSVRILDQPTFVMCGPGGWSGEMFTRIGQHLGEYP